MTAGRFSDVLEPSSEVIRLLEQSGNPSMEGILAWRVFRVQALTGCGRFAQAEFELREVLARRTSLAGPDTRATLRIRTDLVEVVRRAGRIEEATRLAEALLDDRRRIHGDADPQTIEAQRVLDELRKLSESGEPDDPGASR